MNYFGCGSVYCIEVDEVKVVYIIDNEFYFFYKKEIDFIDFVKFV